MAPFPLPADRGCGPDRPARGATVVELHDCFSANELLTYEALGLAREGTVGGAAWHRGAQGEADDPSSSTTLRRCVHAR